MPPSRFAANIGRSPRSVPGIQVCERLPRIARIMDKVTLDPRRCTTR